MDARTPARSRVLIVDDDRMLRQALAALLERADHEVVQVDTGPEAVARLSDEAFDVMLLDMGLPGMSGLDVLEQISGLASAPRVVVVTADDTPEMLLKAVRGQADRYVTKPSTPAAIVDVVEEVLKTTPASVLPIEVVSARPDWVEIVAPCSLEVANRIHAFMLQLGGRLPADVRESVGQAFRELLCNAVEWGGKLDPTRKVRISYIHARRMLLYRIADPGDGFDLGDVTHAAINNPDDNPLHHAHVREEKGLRPGGLGLVITRSLVDELIYNEARNEVVLIKYLD